MNSLGYLVKVEYRDMNPKVKMDTSVFVLHFRAPDGEMYEHPLGNGPYDYENQALQFMAKNGVRPSDFDDTAQNIEDWEWYIPLVRTPDGYGLAQTALSGGVQALKDATWFNPEGGEESNSGDHSGPQSGPGPDPGTGNRGGVDHGEQSPRITLTPNERTGVNITVQ